jgi:biotin carboxyl carrier protein
MQYSYQRGLDTHHININSKEGYYQAEIGDQLVEFKLIENSEGVITLQIGERIEAIYWAAEGKKKWVSFQGCTYYLEKTTSVARKRTSEINADFNLRSPMPAFVRSVFVQAGDYVNKTETLLLLEAMKMEIRIISPISSKIAGVLVKEGDRVDRDQVLVVFEEV